MSLTHTANAAGRRRSALAPAAAGDGSEQCLWWRLLFAALLPGRSGFLLLPALLGLAGGGRSAWGGGRSARGRGGCSARGPGSACNGGGRAPRGGRGGGAPPAPPPPPPAPGGGARHTGRGAAGGPGSAAPA